MAVAYNGWPVIENGAGIDKGFSVRGVTFPGGVLADSAPQACIRYLLEQFDSRIEPLVVGWCWGWEPRQNVNNPGTWSTHSTGVAVDVNAPEHSNGASGTFTSAQVAELRKIMAEVPVFQWGGDYSGTPDEMHLEIIVDAGTVDRVAASLPDNPGGDWFDMATKDELEQVVQQVIADNLDDIANKVWSFKEKYKTSDGTVRELSIHDMIGEIRGQV